MNFFDQMCLWAGRMLFGGFLFVFLLLALTWLYMVLYARLAKSRVGRRFLVTSRFIGRQAEKLSLFEMIPPVPPQVESEKQPETPAS